MNYRDEAPAVILDFLVYHETIKAHSQKTVDEYFLDLRNFFRFMKLDRELVSADTPMSEIPIKDIDLAFVGSVTMNDIYKYLSYLARDREKHYNQQNSDKGIMASSRARKISTLKSFYGYLTNKTKKLTKNPLADLDSPKFMKTLPRYLSLDESKKLLESVEGNNAERDYCIITLFLNCGLRISELIGLNITDIKDDALRVLGKGNKERIIYLNDSCISAINDYLLIRRSIATAEKNALFLSSRRTRISKSTVHHLVKTRLLEAGLDSSKYSAHKLRHTAATLMLHNGVDVRTLQELLGHEHLNTTQIYTHVENEQLRAAAQMSPLSELTRGDGSKKNTDDEDPPAD